jgi:hypothetical protein
MNIATMNIVTMSIATMNIATMNSSCYPSVHQGADPLYLQLDNSDHKCPLPPWSRPGQLYVQTTIRAGKQT